VASHDFRQPAQSLELMAAALRRARTDEDRRRGAECIAHVAAALRGMVETLTALADLETGRSRPRFTDIPLAAVVSSVLRSLSDAGHGVDCGELSGAVHCDRQWLDAMVRGLVLYALAQCTSGTVRIEAGEHRRRVVLAATFRGAHHHAAFEQMAFLEPAQDEDGSARPLGLGPALAARLARRLGGRLQLDALRDGRSRIGLALPAAVGHPSRR
jgi:signal transduction histidine kinase